MKKNKKWIKLLWTLIWNISESVKHFCIERKRVSHAIIPWKEYIQSNKTSCSFTKTITLKSDETRNMVMYVNLYPKISKEMGFFWNNWGYSKKCKNKHFYFFFSVYHHIEFLNIINRFLENFIFMNSWAQKSFSYPMQWLLTNF